MVSDMTQCESFKLLNYPSFAFDSRKIKKGGFFFALTGEKVNGHSFLQEVAEKGAAGGVVAKEYQGPSFGMTLLYVDDVKKCLQDLAREKIRREQQPIIGVTGTVGKTTTKDFIATLLEEKYRVLKPEGSANSQVGLPLTILNAKGEKDLYVLEYGMSLPGEIHRLIEIAPPTVGVLTAISWVHAENFRSMDEIAEAKCELFSSDKMEEAMIHHSLASFPSVQKIGCLKRYYGKDEGFFYEGKELEVPFKESHFCDNLKGALMVAHRFGLSFEEVSRGIKKFSFSPHRFQRLVRNGVQIIDDSYNASPASMRAGLANLPRPMKGGKTIAVLGEMKELGEISEKCHEEMGHFALPLVDELICYGKETLPLAKVFEEEGKGVCHFENLDLVAKKLKGLSQEGDVVFIKGSNSNRLWTILDPSR